MDILSKDIWKIFDRYSIVRKVFVKGYKNAKAEKKEIIFVINVTMRTTSFVAINFAVIK